MKRLFAAIKTEPDLVFLQKYGELRAALRHESIKWVQEQSVHVTLHFFGETDEQRIPLICKTLKEVAETTNSFMLRLEGLGIFGSVYAPRVIWTGLAPQKEILELMKRVKAGLAASGFEIDQQNLVPHLTLGRIKMLQDKVLFQRVIERYKDLSSAGEMAGKMILFESILKPSGPVYTVQQAFPFKHQSP